MPCFTLLLLLVSVSIIFPWTAAAQSTQKPVSESELMALVAGNALTENIVHQVQSRGLAFQPSEIYKTQLKNAGADAPLLTALEKAKVISGSGAQNGPTELELMAHLSNAGRLLRTNQFGAATAELTVALPDGAEAECGFVMGEVLRREEQFDLAVSVYRKVLRQNPDFPEVHTKFAFALYRTKQFEDAMREARLALEQNSENAEAHKNLALALMGHRDFDASIAEYRESLRIKPDYAVAHFDLALAYNAKHNVTAAIKEYRKAVALDPSNASSHYMLASLLKDTGDTEGAIHEYREAKRVAPDRVDVRHDLALALADVDPEASVNEFHDLIAMAPDFELAHVGLGVTYSREGKFGAAETEDRIAIQMDPSDAIAHSNLGYDLAKQNKYDEAMQEFVRAAELDDNSARAHAGIGRMYLIKKKYADAARELRRAEVLDTSLWTIHRDLADALAASGDDQGAIEELKQGETLSPQNYRLMSKLAPLLEKTGDKSGALQQYRLAAEISDAENARKDYSAAQVRLGGNAPAQFAGNKPPQPAPVATNAVDMSNPESAWRNSMDASRRALNGQLLTDAEKSALTAVSLAEKLTPRDSRLLQSVSLLGWVYLREKKYSDGRTTWMRALKLNQELNGPESQESIHALEGVAGCAYQLKDFSTAEAFYSRAVEVEEKNLGPSNPGVISDLYWLGFSYQEAGTYAKAEPIFLKLLQTNSAAGHDGLFAQGDLLILAKLYLAWSKLDQAETYARKSLDQRERDYGSDSPMILESLQTLADVLRRMGKSGEAAQIQKRHDVIKATFGSTFGVP